MTPDARAPIQAPSRADRGTSPASPDSGDCPGNAQKHSVERLLQSWCPTCREWTVIDAGRPCAWCDTVTIRKRGGWRRPDAHRFTRAQLQVFATLHMRGATLRDIGRAMYERLGYSSPESCSECIREGLHREGLYVRPQGTATGSINRKRTKRRPDEDRNAYKRRVRREHGYRCSRTGEWKVAS